GLVVERPEVLDRAAAARDDQQVRAGDRPVRRHLVEAADGVGHLAAGGVALNHHRPDDDAAGPALGDAVQDVADHRAGRAGDDADGRGEGRQGLLLRRIEQAFVAQADLQPL
uniref:Nitrite reductase n=1 Tax=Parastrongyloides trichosuri TaxID=131310 RepID=A0A0N4Z692_PARTI